MQRKPQTRKDNFTFVLGKKEGGREKERGKEDRIERKRGSE